MNICNCMCYVCVHVYVSTFTLFSKPMQHRTYFTYMQQFVKVGAFKESVWPQITALAILDGQD